jgi:tight adherence protein C
MLEAFGRRIPPPEDRPPQRAVAAAAGRPAGAARGAALALGAAGALAGALGPAPLVGCPLLAAAGYRLPAAAAGLRVRASRRALDAALPETADLLTVSMNAGLNVPLALQRVALHAPEPLRSELDRVNGEIALGRPLRDALAALADRTGTDEMQTLVSILRGAGRFGSRVGDSLERWSDDLWTRRRHQVEAEARRAPVKILFPLVFLILPAFLLTTVVPLLLSTLRTLGY